MTTALSHVPQVAVFDTAFHASLDPEAYCYALPRSWREDWGIRRYGFHGLSHSYCSKRAAEMLGRNIEDVRLIVCHLGHGCSATAIRHGRCVDTTMGFTPLDGLVMATRCGELDPGIVLYVQREHGLSPGEIESILNRESGLHGLTGISGDMREVLAASESGNADARLAIEIYARRIRKTIGAYLAVLQGVDAIVFTAGVGENAPRIRQQVCQGLGFLGIEIDEALNSQARPDADVASKSSRCRIFVIATNEERTMYEEVVRVLKN